MKMNVNINAMISYLEWKQNEIGLTHDEVIELKELLKIKYEGVL